MKLSDDTFGRPEPRKTSTPMMKWIGSTALIGVGVVLGFMLRTPGEEHPVRTFRLTDFTKEYFQGFDADLKPYGVKARVENWLIVSLIGETEEYLVVYSDGSRRPRLIVVRGKIEERIKHIMTLDTDNREIIADFDEQGLFTRYSLILQREDARYSFNDEAVIGRFTTKYRLDEPKGIWGQVSAEEWLPLRRSGEAVSVKVGDTWVPADLKDGWIEFSYPEGEEPKD